MRCRCGILSHPHQIIDLLHFRFSELCDTWMWLESDIWVRLNRPRCERAKSQTEC